ncbi:MAG TPA: DUF192 domain-containing protein [Candidatus Acidoferrales bacterium]|nr:DUF192 domain-containing protein [Candidatus Acidoferrales bacterium]
MMLLSVIVAVAVIAGATPATEPFCGPRYRGVAQPAVANRSCRLYDVATPRGVLALYTATDEAQREYGLMYQTRLPAHSGMIFKFPDGDLVRVFWMKNTLIPLDMVFVKADGVVSSVAADVPATKESTPDEQVPRRSGVGEYVIELNAGEAASDGLRRGVRLRLAHLDAL